MKPKVILVIVLGVAGLGMGAMNWVNYFKKGPGATRPEIVNQGRKNDAPAKTSSSPAAQSSETKSEGVSGQQGFKLDAAPSDPVSAGTSGSSSDGPVEKSIFWPDTVGRNPFLSPDEIEKIARGEEIEETVTETPSSVSIVLPEIKVSGVIRDSRTGNLRAIIEGKVYSVGDKVGVETVTEITPQWIGLEYSGRKRMVSLERNKTATGAGSDNKNEIIMKEVP